MITKNASGSNLSSAYNTALASNGRTWQVRLYLNGSLMSATIGTTTFYRGACGDEPFSGALFIPYMDCELKGISTDLEGKTIEAQIGLLTNRASNTWEWTKIGKYIVSKPERTNGVVNFRAVGTLGTVGSGAATITATTYSAIIAQVTAGTGIAINTQGLTLTGSPTAIPEGTWRDVVASIAKDFGAFLTEDVNGNWVIAKYCSGSVAAVGADRSKESPQYDEQTYTLAGQTVQSGTVDMNMGNPLLDPWDRLSVTDVNNATHSVPCLRIVHTLNGGLSTFVDALAETATEQTATISGPVTKNMQHFWTDADGAHVTEMTKDEFVVSPSGGNVLLDSTGLSIKDGNDKLAKFEAYTETYFAGGRVLFGDEQDAPFIYGGIYDSSGEGRYQKIVINAENNDYGNGNGGIELRAVDSTSGDNNVYRLSLNPYDDEGGFGNCFYVTTPRNNASMSFGGFSGLDVENADYYKGGLKYLVYEDYTFTGITWAAGTPGTRGFEDTKDGSKTGYTPVSATVIAGNTYYCSFVAKVATGGTVTLSAYRATTGAISNYTATVRVFYIRT